MIVTEADLRDQLRRPVMGAQVTVPTGARLSPSAADFVKQWALVMVDPDTEAHARPEATGGELGEHHRDWDKASVFPVNLAGELPSCLVCGTPLKKKPSELTQLDAHHFVLKTHPRIKLRGEVDSLHALVLLIQRMARQEGDAMLAHDLGTIAAYCRELTSAEYNARPVAQLELNDWDAERIYQATHDPLGTLGIDHLTIDENEPELQHWLNMARTRSREIEITAMETFGTPAPDWAATICHAFNRLSSTFYFLQLRMKAGVQK